MLKHSKSDIAVLPGFTVCLRFNLTILGTIDQQLRGKLLTIADWNATVNGDCSLPYECLLDLFAVHPHSVLNVGFSHNATRSNFNSYLLQSSDPDVGYNIIYPNKWHHICIAFKSFPPTWSFGPSVVALERSVIC